MSHSNRTRTSINATCRALVGNKITRVSFWTFVWFSMILAGNWIFYSLSVDETPELVENTWLGVHDVLERNVSRTGAPAFTLIENSSSNAFAHWEIPKTDQEQWEMRRTYFPQSADSEFDTLVIRSGQLDAESVSRLIAVTRPTFIVFDECSANISEEFSKALISASVRGIVVSRPSPAMQRSIRDWYAWFRSYSTTGHGALVVTNFKEWNERYIPQRMGVSITDLSTLH